MFECLWCEFVSYLDLRRPENVSHISQFEVFPDNTRAASGTGSSITSFASITLRAPATAATATAAPTTPGLCLESQQIWVDLSGKMVSVCFCHAMFTRTFQYLKDLYKLGSTCILFAGLRCFVNHFLLNSRVEMPKWHAQNEELSLQPTRSANWGGGILTSHLHHFASMWCERLGHALVKFLVRLAMSCVSGVAANARRGGQSQVRGRRGRAWQCHFPWIGLAGIQ